MLIPGHGIPVNSVSTVALYGNVLYGGNGCLQSGRLSERATSKLALNVEWECPSATYGCTELALPDPEKGLDLPKLAWRTLGSRRLSRPPRLV